MNTILGFCKKFVISFLIADCARAEITTAVRDDASDCFHTNIQSCARLFQSLYSKSDFIQLFLGEFSKSIQKSKCSFSLFLPLIFYIIWMNDDDETYVVAVIMFSNESYLGTLAAVIYEVDYVRSVKNPFFQGCH